MPRKQTITEETLNLIGKTGTALFHGQYRTAKLYGIEIVEGTKQGKYKIYAKVRFDTFSTKIPLKRFTPND